MGCKIESPVSLSTLQAGKSWGKKEAERERERERESMSMTRSNRENMVLAIVVPATGRTIFSSSFSVEGAAMKEKWVEFLCGR